MAKIDCGSQSVVIVRWIRLAIEHPQDVPLVGEARSGVYFDGLFVQSLFLSSTFCFIFITCFSLFCFGCVLFSKKCILLWVCLSTFLCFIWLRWDLKVTFKRIIYPVLIWFWSGLGTVGFSWLVMLLVCGFVTLVSFVGYLNLLSNSSDWVKGKFETCEN